MLATFDSSHFHPMVVHFPIALLIVGFLFEIAQLYHKKEPCFSKIGFYLMVLGTLGAIAAFFSGEYFTEEMTGPSGELKELHELYAKITMYVMIGVSVIRSYALFFKNNDRRIYWFTFALYGVATVCVGIAGFLGGSLVYNYMITP